MGLQNVRWTAAVALLLGFSPILATSPALAADGDAWSVALGAGAVSLPKYPGSRATRVDAFPAVHLRYRRFFLGPGGLGAYLYEGRHWKLGATLSGDFRKQREEIDDPRHLHGLGDINGTVRAGMLASYTRGWFTLRGDVRYDLEDHHNHEGMLASLEGVARYSPFPRLTLTAGPSVTFANQRYMQTFFGIDAIQSERSGYAEYAPRGGVALAGVSLGAEYRLTAHWIIAAHAAAERLQGNAARSTIVENKNQNVYALFAIYRF